MIYVKFLLSLLRHKWFVFLAGHKIGVPLWRLILHDWSKFTPAEFGPYAKKFQGDYSECDRAESAFSRAWLHHENRNAHHWGYWILRSGKNKGDALPMPMVDVMEMVADWHGASKAYTGSWNIAGWLSNQVSDMEFNLLTVHRIHDVMLNLGYILTDNCNWSFAWVGKNEPIE